MEDRSIIQTQWDENSGLGDTGSQLLPVIIHQMLLILPPKYLSNPVFAPHSKYSCLPSSPSTWPQLLTNWSPCPNLSCQPALLVSNPSPTLLLERTFKNKTPPHAIFLFIVFCLLQCSNTPEGYNMLPPEEGLRWLMMGVGPLPNLDGESLCSSNSFRTYHILHKMTPVYLFNLTTMAPPMWSEDGFSFSSFSQSP